MNITWTIKSTSKKVEELLKAAGSEKQFFKMCTKAFGFYHLVMTLAHYSKNKWYKHDTGREASVYIGPPGIPSIRVNVSI